MSNYQMQALNEQPNTLSILLSPEIASLLLHQSQVIRINLFVNGPPILHGYTDSRGI